MNGTRVDLVNAFGEFQTVHLGDLGEHTEFAGISLEVFSIRC